MSKVVPDAAESDLDEREPTDIAAESAARRPWTLAIWLILAGIVGEIAAFALTLEKLHALANPGEAASCDFSVLYQCTANLDSPQGSIFGFPNPLIGLIGWMAPIVVGVSLLAGARFPRWYWAVFNLGMAGAMALVVYLISQSIYAPNLGTLCPWCMVTWSVTIPSFWAVTFRNIGAGVFGNAPRLRGAGRALLTWVVPITLICYAVIVLLAQLEPTAPFRIFI